MVACHPGSVEAVYVPEACYSVFGQQNQYNTDLTHWLDMSVQPTHSQQPLRGSAVPGFTDKLQAVWELGLLLTNIHLCLPSQLLSSLHNTGLAPERALANGM